MSDFNSSLPVRSENNGDVAVKVVDGTVTSQALNVDSSGRVTTKLDDGNGNIVTSQANGAQRALDVGIDVAGVQIDPRDQGNPNTVANSWPVKITDGTNISAVKAASTAATVTDPSQVVALSPNTPLPAGTNSLGTVLAKLEDGAGNAITSSAAGGTRPLDVALRDGSGNLYSNSNPVPVYVSASSAGTKIDDYKAATAIAAAGFDNHDYTVTAGKTLTFNQVEASASGKMKIEVQIETGVATNVFNSKFVKFNSTATPNMSVILQDAINVAAGVRVRIICTNEDKAAQDLYSTICGVEN